MKKFIAVLVIALVSSTAANATTYTPGSSGTGIEPPVGNGTAPTTTTAPAAQPTNATAQEAPAVPPAQLPQEDLEGGLHAGEAWLKFIDGGNYTGSWDNGALQFKTVVSKSDWDTAMKKLRQPLGTVKDRKLADLRTAINPPGVAKGDYIVLVYNTNFSARPNAGELLTLVKESDGQWRVMSYFAR